MKPGLLLAGRFPPDRTVAIARLAEDVGFGQIWIADERFFREVYEYLTLLAVNTSRIELGPCVTDPYSRHPALTAVAIATLDEISNGRALLGIGAGLSGFREMGVDRKKPVVAMREAIDLIRRLLRGGEVDFRGELISFDNGHLDFAPLRPDIPVWIASNGPLGQTLAGRVAQGVIMEACGSIREAEAFLKRVQDAARKAERDAGAVKCMTRLNFCVADSGKTARDTMRARVGRNMVAGYMSFSLLPSEGQQLPPDLVAQVAGLPYTNSVEAFEILAPHVTDEMVDAMTLAGSIDEAIEHSIALCRCGLDGMIISPNPAPGYTVEDNIRIFGEKIWPEVEKHVPHVRQA